MCGIISSSIFLSFMFAGFGAFLGLMSAIYIQDRKEKRSLRLQLIAKLMAFRDFEFAIIEGEKRENRIETYRETFSEIYALAFTYREMISGEDRRRLDEGWKKYKGTEDAKMDVSFYVRPSNEQQIEERICALLEALK